MLLDRLQKSQRKWVGREVNFAVKLNRNLSGVGWRGEQAVLPTAGNQVTAQSLIRAKYVYGRFALTGQAIASAKQGRGAFEDAMTLEMEGIKDDVKRNVNIILWNDGTGIVTSVNGSVNLSTTGNTTVPVINSRLLRVGQPVDFVQANAAVSTATIVSIGAVTQITVGPATVATSLVTGNGIVNSGDLNNVSAGMQNIVDDGSISAIFQNINRALNPAWKSVVLANGGNARAYTEDLLQQLDDLVHMFSGHETAEYWTDFSVRREILNYVKSDVRYEPTKFYSGFKICEFNGKPIYTDWHVQPLGAIYGLNFKWFRKYVLEDFQFANEDGRTLRASGVGAGGVDQWEGYMKAYINLGSEMAAGCGLLKDISYNYPSVVLNS